MKKRAVWIFDYHFRVPAFLSISSFLDDFDIPVTVLYCGGREEAETAAKFRQLSPRVSFESYTPLDPVPENAFKGTILNRLARMDTMIRSKNELLFLFDADVFFGAHSKELINALEFENRAGGPDIWGCVDDILSASNVLYFRVWDERNRAIKLSSLEKADIYNAVFGDAWQRFHNKVVFNNGVLIFRDCQKLGQKWKDYYLKGLELEHVNPGDDQYPLAVAIQTESCTQRMISHRFNSMGKINGDFAVFHAFSGIWRMQLLAVLKKGLIVSEVGKILQKYAVALPKQWIEPILKNSFEPFCYHSIPGDFRFKHLYEDIVDDLEYGHCVEVGTYHGKSACFMAEHIKYSGKSIQFDTIDDFTNQEYSYRKAANYLELFEVSGYLNMYSLPSVEAARKYEGQSLDFVFLNGQPDYTTLFNDLKIWYPKLRPGGVLAGYDYGSQDGLRFGHECATYRFCKKYRLSLRIDYDIFIIQIPDQKIKVKKNDRRVLAKRKHSEDSLLDKNAS